MNIAAELRKFTADAQKRGLDLSGDKQRFFHPKTAQAWTKHFQFWTNIYKIPQAKAQ